MFREMRRIRQQLPEEECIEILKKEWRGVLSVFGEDGYPYGMPLDFCYDEESGTLLFHGAAQGHKIDALRKNNKVSFCVYDEGYRTEDDWALNIRSVIIFGRVRIIEDREETIRAVRKIGLKYYPTAEGVEEEIVKAGNRVCCFELTIDHMTGKLVNEK